MRLSPPRSLPYSSNLRAILALTLVAAMAGAAPADVVSKCVGRLTMQVRTEHAHPGGVLDVLLLSKRHLGTIRVFFEGRATPSYGPAGRLRAIVPAPLSSGPGPVTLGIELRVRRGRQRMRIDASVADRAYPARAVALPKERMALLEAPHATRDGRELMLLARTLSDTAWWADGFSAPIDAPADGDFGALPDYGPHGPVAQRMDGTWGERQRGWSYPVPLGSPVAAPAGGSVIFAGSLTLAGWTLVVDHGQGFVSVLRHLSRLDVVLGDDVTRGQQLGLSGASGLVAAPLLHWSLFLHGIAVDPQIAMAVTQPRVD